MYNVSMRINRKFAIIGLVMCFIPFLGIPDTWKFVLFIILGLSIIISSVEFLQPKKKGGRKAKTIKIAETFAENSYMEPKIEIKQRPVQDVANDTTHDRIYE